MKQTKFIRVLAVMLAVVLLFAGCGGGKKTTTGTVDVSQSKYGTEYPITTDTTLKIWTRYGPDSKYLKVEEQPAYVETEKRTGIKAEYIYSSGDPDEAFNLLIASGEYPDIIIHRWLGSSYSPTNAMEEGVILPLNDIFEAYTPNVKKHLEQDAERAKYWKNDDGKYFAFPNFSEKNGAPWLGPIVRADLMEKLNLETPETIDDWTNMLRTFQANGIESPLTMMGGFISDVRFAGFIFGAYETAFDFYKDANGKLQYGPLTPEFKTAVAQLNSWYQEGLLDSEFVSTDDAMISQKMLGNQAAVTDYFLSRLESWPRSSKEAGNNYTYAALPYPVLEKGAPREFGYMPEAYNVSAAQDVAAISAQCKDVELAAKYLDFWYSDEGIMLSNFGIEGETYTLENDEIKLLPTFDENFDLIMPYIKYYVTALDSRFGALRYKLQSQKDAQKIWVNNMSDHAFPPVSATPAESDEMSAKLSDITSYANESVLKFIVGQDSLDNYDKFVENLKAKGIERVLEIKQGQLDRFNNR